MTPSSQRDLLDVQHLDSLSPESSWVLILRLTLSSNSALAPDRGIAKSQGHLRIVRSQAPGTRDTPRGHSPSREEWPQGLPFCANQDSKPSKPADRAYNSPACHPPNKSPKWRWFDFIWVVPLCSDMPVCPPFCSPASAPSAAPPSHAPPLRTGAVQKRHSAKGRGKASRARQTGELRGRGPRGPCWGTQHGSASWIDN